VEVGCRRVDDQRSEFEPRGQADVGSLSRDLLALIGDS
jgi:hypothetical protein